MLEKFIKLKKKQFIEPLDKILKQQQKCICHASGFYA